MTLNSSLMIGERSRLKEKVGTAEAQIWLLTDRVVRLGAHLDVHKRDYSSRRGLKQLLATRKRLLYYLLRKDISQYKRLVVLLDIRDIQVE